MSYNGHKNWNQWNVSLWINNDEGLYYLARHCVKTSSNKECATLALLSFLKGKVTPDGAPYTKTSIRNAIRDM